MKPASKTRITSPDGASVISFNHGVTINNYTTITQNTVKAYLPHSYAGYNYNNTPVRLPKFKEPKDIGMILEVTPYFWPDKKVFHFDYRAKYSQILDWELGEMPKTGTQNLNTRIELEQGKVVLLKSTLINPEGDDSKESKAIFDLHFLESFD